MQIKISKVSNFNAGLCLINKFEKGNLFSHFLQHCVAQEVET